MAREDRSVSQFRICGNCRTRVALDRRRCPKCRVTETVTDPAVVAARSKRLALISGSMLAVALIALAVLYMQQPTQTAASVPTGTVADPLAARRAAAAAAAATNQEDAAAPLSGDSPEEAAYAAGDGARALEQYRNAVQRNPDDADARTALGHMLARLKRFDEALNHYERALALDPHRHAHYTNIAGVFTQLGRWEDAVNAYRRALQLQPNDAVVTLDLAKALHKKGDDVAAVDEFQKAVALAPNDAPVRMALAESYEALNRREDAVQAYTDYLKIAPSGPDSEKARTRILRLSSQPSEAGAAGQS